ncbi:hypothetical protein RO3G_04893 [Rhizopus delemar RA 99-880]|uniref:Uncharacterized protein n=1 Tax=Rhizopus delemar (strain RA 99-880 / ATCC MYA-4621 / FGSC 9543 / NRRL 43880) TaxID=246409 RepID=I1BVF8_RHIO9|nr:hypothetical protein RO3G_04893 [Rhizopus delemar RA 99-880]|eukprot:EIE80188.1 hypothetical protein RO3G_04893 [Rhizopus delemar RA 99-880]
MTELAQVINAFWSQCKPSLSLLRSPKKDEQGLSILVFFMSLWIPTKIVKELAMISSSS